MELPHLENVGDKEGEKQKLILGCCGNPSEE